MSRPTEHLPVLAGDGFDLRPPRPGEVARVVEAITSDPVASAWWGADPAVVMRWFEEDDVDVLLVCTDDGPAGIITYTEVNDPDYRSAGIDIGLLSDRIGRGMGSAALRLLARWLFEERGHHRLTIDPAVANERAVRAYEKVGFKRIGVARQYERGNDGTYHDNLLMDMLAGEVLGPGEG